jgi:cell division protein ZapA
MKQLEVQIMGQSYLLGCPEDGDARMLDAVNRVDIAMCKIRDAGKIKARDRIAVLAALNLAFEVSEPAKQPGLASSFAANSGQTAGGEAVSVDDWLKAHPQLDMLIHRLDGALGVDGQLL